MNKYLGKVKQCIEGFTMAQFQQILREENIEVDVLSKTAFVDELFGDQIKFQYIPSIDILEVHQIDGIANQTTPIMSHLKNKFLPTIEKKRGS